jgi:hypothetical protein
MHFVGEWMSRSSTAKFNLGVGQLACVADEGGRGHALGPPFNALGSTCLKLLDNPRPIINNLESSANNLRNRPATVETQLSDNNEDNRKGGQSTGEDWH